MPQPRQIECGARVRPTVPWWPESGVVHAKLTDDHTREWLVRFQHAKVKDAHLFVAFDAKDLRLL